jgi:hypothetical protein
VIHRIGDIPLSEKASADIPARRQLRMENLDGESLAIAVRCGIDRRHATHTQNVIDMVLAPENRSDSLCSLP